MDALVAFVRDAQFLSDLIVISSNNGKFLFEFAAGRSKVDIDGSEFVDASHGLLVLQFNGLLAAKGLQKMNNIMSFFYIWWRRRSYGFIVAPNFLSLCSEGLDAALRNAELIQSDLQLALNFVVVRRKFGNLERLFLAELLQVDVLLVGSVERHLQLGDLNLQLLLDAGDLGLQLGLGLDDTGIQLFDFDARSFAKNGKNGHKL